MKMSGNTYIKRSVIGLLALAAAIAGMAAQESVESYKLMFGVFVVVILIGLVVALVLHDRVLEKKKGKSDEMAENEAASSEEDILRQRFLEVDEEISRDKLFCNPDFGRDDLTRMIGVDKNTLPGLITRYTGTSVVWYINSKRMDYAVSLMKEHPEFTLNAIAEACGIKSPSTFISHFKTTFGMTPSDYRKTLKLPPLD